MNSHVERKGMSFPVIWCLLAHSDNTYAGCLRTYARKLKFREQSGGASYLVTSSAPHAFGNLSMDNSNSERILPSFWNYLPNNDRGVLLLHNEPLFTTPRSRWEQRLT